MSELVSLLSHETVMIGVKANCRREALTALAKKAADLTNIDADIILSTILERERLGSTGVGNGAAIPHGKLEDLENMVGLCARLERPVAFDAVDDRPVDIVFMLLAPREANAEHLKALSRVARLLRDDEKRRAMRGAETAEALYAIVMEDEKSHAA